MKFKAAQLNGNPPNLVYLDFKRGRCQGNPMILMHNMLNFAFSRVVLVKYLNPICLTSRI